MRFSPSEAASLPKAGYTTWSARPPYTNCVPPKRSSEQARRVHPDLNRPNQHNRSNRPNQPIQPNQSFTEPHASAHRFKGKFKTGANAHANSAPQAETSSLPSHGDQFTPDYETVLSYIQQFSSGYAAGLHQDYAFHGLQLPKPGFDMSLETFLKQFDSLVDVVTARIMAYVKDIESTLPRHGLHHQAGEGNRFAYMPQFQAETPFGSTKRSGFQSETYFNAAPLPPTYGASGQMPGSMPGASHTAGARRMPADAASVGAMPLKMDVKRTTAQWQTAIAEWQSMGMTCTEMEKCFDDLDHYLKNGNDSIAKAFNTRYSGVVKGDIHNSDMRLNYALLRAALIKTLKQMPA